MALPAALREAAKQLPGLAARLAGVPGSGLPLDAAEAGQLAGMLATMDSALGPDDSSSDGSDDDSIIDALLSDDRLLLALLRLVAFAVRGSQQRGHAFRLVADGALGASTSLLLLRTPTAWSARAQLGFGRKLLRMDTLQCCSIAFAEAASVLEATTAGAGGAAAGGGEGGDAEAAAAAAAGSATGPKDQPSFALAQVVYFSTLVDCMLALAARPIGAEFTARQRQQVKAEQRLYARELAAALRGSCVLEHYARWALRVQLAGVPAGALELDRIPLFTGLAFLLQNATGLTTSLKDDGAAAPALREVLSGPCVRHLVLSLGLAALCAADGGPSHGLPEELLFHLPILGRADGDLRGLHGRQLLCLPVLTCMLWMLDDSTTAPATPPLDWRSVVGLLHRIGSLLLTSARSWADEGAEAEAGPQPPRLQFVLGTMDITAVAVPLLQQSRRLVCEQEQAPAAVTSAALAEAEAAWWRLAVDLTTHSVRWARTEDFGALAGLLSCEWGPLPTDGLLPAAPPAAVAALAGGLLPFWERLLRHAGRDPLSMEATLLTCLLSSGDNHGGVCRLLAYAEPRQGVALVATCGKLLRTLAVPQLLSPAGEGDASSISLRTSLARALVAGTAGVLTAALRPVAGVGRHDPAAAAAAEATAPQLQLARLLSFAMCEWLPPLARLTCDGLLAVRLAARGGLLDRGANQKCLDAISLSSIAVLRWLPALALRSGAGLGRTSQSAGQDASAADASAPAPAASGWRQLLLQDAGAMALLGDLLKYTPLASGSADKPNPTVGLNELVAGCCCVAAACPGEVRQAVLAAAAEAAAASSSGGGRGRLPGWSPQLLQLLAAGMRSRQRDEPKALATAASALARQAELWAAGGGEDGGELVRAVEAMASGSAHAALARALVSSPSAAHALLRTCANPACDNLAGDSEAGLPLRACGRCGGAWYCRKECLAAHWRSGHREACAGRVEAAAGAPGPVESAAASSAP
ncbi:hypothetical protein TSOC_004054 [Tetrabaena socialis]|uniref:phytol kinase n=1 Tax=Tetrabaena socialis TaxID=47790 RepID=A0A2J8A9Y8_9CHLO|nr:hypothetical protein TSOC_004054 [Tetrabaena socialis]|eukprot:PNH09330.1 hypothetical protein TSOC_004054 [Tetrabaena socialis]